MRHHNRNRLEILSLFLSVVVMALVWQLSAVQVLHAEDPPDRLSYPLKPKAKPAVGNMAGVKLSIPHHYLLAGVHYKGEEVWTRSRPPAPPRTFESEIEDFSIRLRQSTLKPITTRQDWVDYQEYGRTAHPQTNNRWLTVGFHPDAFALNDEMLKGLVNRYMVDDVTGWGPFIPQDMDVHGLKHAKSTREEKSSVVQADELFYDNATWNTFITCSNNRRKVPPFDVFSHCWHSFPVPELKAVAKAFYNKDDLPRWREIEHAIKDIAHSFIVK